MNNNKKLNVVFCWHMHQPWYRDGLHGEYQLPWVYLHGMKDYSDMAAHLENHPNMRSVVNFAPILLEQIDSYAQQMAAFLNDGTAMQDRLLNLLAGVVPIPADEKGRKQVLADCQRCYAPRMIEPHEEFQRLFDLIGTVDEGHGHYRYALPMAYLSEQFFLDVLTWYHLAWLGHFEQQSPSIQRLLEKGKGFMNADRRVLLQVMQACMADLIPRYKALADCGQIELSVTPYMHPIIPLLQDFSTLKDALPDASVPQAPMYPGGKARARWHMQRGIQVFEQYFARNPHGVWLSEGAISTEAVALLDSMDIRWTASGEGVWRNSCEKSGMTGEAIDNKRALFKPYVTAQHSTQIFFRDDGLSDLIGFKYSDWHADDAARDFVQHLQNIRAFLGDDADEHTVSIILDGENAWEYYPENARYFLDGLYAALTQAPDLNITTFADVSQQAKPEILPALCAGSWVYGSFSTWIGSEDKNRGWDYLVAAKQVFDEVMASNRLSPSEQEEASRQLAVCEGSDWFWWFGDYNPGDSVRDFEQLYRQQLRELYRLLKQDAPDHLDVPLSHGGGSAENSGTMRRNVA